MDTGELLHKLRDEKPKCRICDQVCDPDVEPGVDLLMIQLDALGEGIGFIPVHQGVCRAEAVERLQRAQAAVKN